MVSNTKKTARGAAAAVIAAAAFTMVGPAATGFAINKVECNPDENFSQIWSHSSGGEDSTDCYANGGKMDFGGWWVDKAYAGNNTLYLYDHNGDVLRVDPGKTLTRDTPAKIDAIEIK